MKKKLALASAVAVLACLWWPASPAVAAAGCPPDLPYLVTAPRFQGFLIVCASAGRRHLWIRNVSALVYDVQPTRTSRVEVDGPPWSTLLGLATRRAAPPVCPGSRYCVLPPGGTAYVGGSPAQVYVFSDRARTSVTLAARLVAGQIERRLQPTAMRRIDAVMACAQSLSSTLQGDRWSALRHGLDVTTSCPSLMRELYPTRSQRLALDARVTSVGSRLLKQEGFRELLMSGARTLIRL